MTQNFLRMAALMVLGLTAAVTSVVHAQLHVRMQVESKVADPRSTEVHLYQGNDLIRTLTPNRQGKLDMELALEHIYSIELVQDGALTKRLSFDTRTEHVREDWAKIRVLRQDKPLRTTPAYECFVTMIPVPMNLQSMEDDLAFPVAVLTWHPDGSFGPLRNYTRVSGLIWERANEAATRAAIQR
jgi:hypothetical protein